MKNDACLQNKKSLHNDVMRPSVVPGNVVLFHYRVLHFGLANNNTSFLDDKNAGMLFYVLIGQNHGLLILVRRIC